MSDSTEWTLGWATLGSPSQPSPRGRGRMIHRQSITLVPGFDQRPSATQRSGACCSLSLRERVRVKGNYSVEHAKCSISQSLLSLYQGVQVANSKSHAQVTGQCFHLGFGQKRLRIWGQTHPHPGPLPSDGRGRTVLSRSANPTALESARDGSGCSLSRRTGEGQGEGRFVIFVQIEDETRGS